MKFKNRVFSFIMAISLIFTYSPVYASDINTDSIQVSSDEFIEVEAEESIEADIVESESDLIIGVTVEDETDIPKQEVSVGVVGSEEVGVVGDEEVGVVDDEEVGVMPSEMEIDVYCEGDIIFTEYTSSSSFNSIFDTIMEKITTKIQSLYGNNIEFKVLKQDGTELQRTDYIQDITVELQNLERNFTIYFEYENRVVSSIDKTTTDPTFENMYNDLYDEIYDHAYDLYGNDLSSIDIYNSSDTYLDPTDSIQNLYVIIYIEITAVEPAQSYDITVQKEWVVPKGNIRFYLRDKEGFAFTDFEYLVIADSSGKELERIYRYDENAKGSLIISKEAYSADTDFIITIYNSDGIELGTKIVEGYDLKANIPSRIYYELYDSFSSFSIQTGWLYSYNNWKDSYSIYDNPSNLWIREVTEGNWETAISKTQNSNTSYTFTIENTIKLDPSIIVIELPPQDHFPETGNHGLPIAVIPVFMITSIIITTTYVVKKKNK